ncbi:MAG: hypothetical protein GWP91_05445 [Rhodobacterales bacterium]|nr:hypothetical protein [Rhodobacterales bacterium]
MTSILLLLTGLSFAQDKTVTPPGQVQPEAISAAEAVMPSDVEEGSVQKVHTAKDGDTIDSISMEYGFMPLDLRSWNKIDGEVKAGDEIVLWIPPPEPEPEVETQVAEAESVKETEEKKPRIANGESGLGGFVGAHVGPAFSLSPLGTAVTPRLEGGVVLPMVDRSFRIFVGGQYLKPVASGEGQDVHVTGGWDYEMKQDELSFSFGVGFRPGMLKGKIKPEVSVGPNIYLYRSTVNGSAAGAVFPESTEQYTRVGLYASGGASVDLGPGELAVLFTMASSGLNGVVTGEAASAALSPSLGYRLVF